jgi:hypothetical protein
MRLPQRVARNNFARLYSGFMLLAVALTLPGMARATTEQLSFSPPLIRFGEVPVGKSVTQPVVLTNTSAQSAEISAISIDDSEFSVSGIQLPAVLAPGQSVSLQLGFAPSQKGYSGVFVTFTTNMPNPRLVLPVSGAGVVNPLPTVSPSSLSFGNVPVGTTSSLPVVISCTSCSEIITGLSAEGSAFSVSGPGLPITLSPKYGVTLEVAFEPETAGLTAGEVVVHGLGLSIPFTGTGTVSSAGQLSITPSQLSFGDVNVGSDGAQTSTLTASGGSVTVSSGTSSNSEFTISGISFPLTLASGQSAEFKAVFTPTKTGAVSGTLSFTSNTSAASESLSGTGSTPQYSVALSWNPSTSSVAGYNVYRGTTAGAYSKINSALDSTTTYTDATVLSGTTYYYAATAVSSSGQESGYSAPLKVSIP